MLMALTNDRNRNCPPPPSPSCAPNRSVISLCPSLPLFFTPSFHAASLFFCFSLGNKTFLSFFLHCVGLHGMATLKFAVFCCSATLMWRRRTASNFYRTYYNYQCYEATLCLRKLMSLLSFSQRTPLHWSAIESRLELCRLLVESKADVAARDRCFSPPSSHHLSLTDCFAAVATLHSK
jgi:hypothetical protein